MTPFGADGADAESEMISNYCLDLLPITQYGDMELYKEEQLLIHCVATSSILTKCGRKWSRETELGDRAESGY